MTRALRMLIASVMLCSGLALGLSSPVHAATDPVQKVLAELNVIRATAGVGPLVLTPGMTAEAQTWSTAMANGSCGVNGLCHRTDLAALATRQAGNTWWLVGENIATMFGTDPAAVDDVMARFQNSPGHKANNENGQYTMVGIAFATSPNGLVYLTIDFLGAPVQQGTPALASGRLLSPLRPSPPPRRNPF